MDFFNRGEVGLAVTQCYQYPDKKMNFRPDTAYPEYLFGKENISSDKNEVYAAVRESLRLLGLDKEHYGTSKWNPLGEFVKPGDNVLIKPNLVMDHNPSGEGTDCLYTQPSVVAPIIDYVYKALNGKGKIVVGDAPMQECKFEKLIEESGYKTLAEWYRRRGCDVEIVDFRELKSEVINGIHVQHINDKAKGTVINLGHDSEFSAANADSFDKMRITDYDPDILKQHHSVDKNEYYISDYVLNADCIINMPKPKCHRKAGVTIALKNMVGINVRKEYLPHHTMGSVEEGGDEYDKKNIIHALRSKMWDKRNKCSAENKLMAANFYNFLSKVCAAMLRLSHSKYSEGSWWGNHTISRTIADLNKIVFYADKTGKMCVIPQRKMLIVADMIISGEKEGPVAPSSKNVGIIASGINPVCFDRAITALMGFDKKKIPTLKTTQKIKGKYKLVGENVVQRYYANSEKYNMLEPAQIPPDLRLNFIPTDGWKGHIEM